MAQYPNRSSGPPPLRLFRALLMERFPKMTYFSCLNGRFPQVSTAGLWFFFSAGSDKNYTVTFLRCLSRKLVVSAPALYKKPYRHHLQASPPDPSGGESNSGDASTWKQMPKRETEASLTRLKKFMQCSEIVFQLQPTPRRFIPHHHRYSRGVVSVVFESISSFWCPARGEIGTQNRSKRPKNDFLLKSTPRERGVSHGGGDGARWGPPRTKAGEKV